MNCKSENKNRPMGGQSMVHSVLCVSGISMASLSRLNLCYFEAPKTASVPNLSILIPQMKGPPCILVLVYVLSAIRRSCFKSCQAT